MIKINMRQMGKTPQQVLSFSTSARLRADKNNTGQNNFFTSNNKKMDQMVADFSMEIEQIRMERSYQNEQNIKLEDELNSALLKNAEDRKASSSALDANNDTISNVNSKMADIQRSNEIWLPTAPKNTVDLLRTGDAFFKGEAEKKLVTINNDNPHAEVKITSLAHTEQVRAHSTNTLIGSVFKSSNIELGDEYKTLEKVSEFLASKDVELTAKHIENVKECAALNEKMEKVGSLLDEYADVNSEMSDPFDPDG